VLCVVAPRTRHSASPKAGIPIGACLRWDPGCGASSTRPSSRLSSRSVASIAPEQPPEQPLLPFPTASSRASARAQPHHGVPFEACARDSTDAGRIHFVVNVSRHGSPRRRDHRPRQLVTPTSPRVEANVLRFTAGCRRRQVSAASGTQYTGMPCYRYQVSVSSTERK